MSALVVTLDTLILNVALPTLVRELHASTSELQSIVDAYLLVLAGLLLVAGSLGDRFGRAKVLRIGLVVFGITSTAAAFSPNAATLVLCRGLMGIGAALILPASMAILANVFTDPQERARALGIWSAVSGLGFALGPTVGGLLLSQFWWGSVFLVNVPIVLAAFVVGWWTIPDSRNPEAARFDPVGVVLSVVGVSGLVWATIQAPTHGWGSLVTLGSFAAAFALLGCFVVWELRFDHPMLELRFFRNPRFSVATLMAGMAQMAYTGMLFVLTQLLQSVFGYSPLAAGIRLVPLASTYMVAGWFGPRLVEHLGTKRAVTLGFATFAAGLVVLATANEHAGYVPVVVAMVAFGFGFGATVAPITEAVVGAVPREKAGVASATLSTTRQVGGALGVAVVGSLLVSGYHAVLETHTRVLELSGADRALTRTSLGAALGVARRLGGTTGLALSDAASAAFIHGMHLGVIACVALGALGAVLALRYLPARAHDGPPPTSRRALLVVDAVVD